MSELESNGKFKISASGKTHNFGVTKMIHQLFGFCLFSVFNKGEKFCVRNWESTK